MLKLLSAAHHFEADSSLANSDCYQKDKSVLSSLSLRSPLLSENGVADPIEGWTIVLFRVVSSGCAIEAI